MSNPKFFHLKHRIKSVGYACEGIVTFFKTQPNAWIQLFAAIAIIVVGFLMKISRWEWCWIIVSIALVIITEMLNTALEFLTDLVSPSFHPVAKKVKDVAAGAVLIAAMTSVIIAAIIFLPKLL
jgi:diacylglycerol kinase (ATP)